MTATNCTSCVSGYDFLAQAYRCTPSNVGGGGGCTSCPPVSICGGGCLDCENDLYCNQCAPGFYRIEHPDGDEDRATCVTSCPSDTTADE